MTTPTTVENLPERFWVKVEKTDDCWIWRGARTPAGYGEIRIGARTPFAHRVAYELTVGIIPLNKMVCHTCDHPWCVRPDHLFIGTAKDNQADMTAKGRGRVGERNGRAKLTEAQVVWIRENYNLLPRGLRHSYVKSMGVTPRVIYLILHGKGWKT